MIGAARPKIRIEPWSVDYGSSNEIDDSTEPAAFATIPEDEPFGFVNLGEPPVVRLAFVDGIQQIEARLVQIIADRYVPGLACALAVGAVTLEPGQRPEFAHLRPRRLCIWAAGSVGALPAIRGGWRWREMSVPDTGQDATKKAMESERKTAEAALAHQLDNEGWHVVCDGTDGRLFLPRANGTQRQIMGCIKSQHVRLLPDPQGAELHNLATGERTTLFLVPTNRRYSCYVRFGEPQSWQSPLAGISRLEFAPGFTLEEARRVADTFASNLLRFAGIPHVDPRAPQNLQPIGALERHLRRILGDAELAQRAIREAVKEAEA
jgi:hypothetical protein